MITFLLTDRFGYFSKQFAMRHLLSGLMISFMTLFVYSLNFTCMATPFSQTYEGKNHDEDAAMMYKYIAAADKTKILGVLLDEFGVEETSNIYGRIPLARSPNGRGQEIVVEAIVSSEKGIPQDTCPVGFNIMLVNVCDGRSATYYLIDDYAILHEKLTALLSKNIKSDKSARQYEVYAFWDECLSIMAYTVGCSHWPESNLIGLSN